MAHIWVDKLLAIDVGQKRHVYEEADSGRLIRACRNTRGGSVMPESSDIERVEGTEFALRPNVCENCLRTTGLKSYRENNRVTSEGSADDVDYDPFGVFRGGQGE